MSILLDCLFFAEEEDEGDDEAEAEELLVAANTQGARVVNSGCGIIESTY